MRLIAVGLVSSALHAEDAKSFHFKDAFERNETQKVTDEVGEGWGSNSTKETKGKSRQFDLKDGALHAFRYAGTKHPASLTRSTDFQDGAFEMRFMLEHAEDAFELTFIDPAFDGSKNGMLFAIELSTTELALTEQKTGGSSAEYRDANKAGTLTPEQQAALATKHQTIPNALELGKWHALLAKIQGDTLSVAIDGKVIGTLKSAGVAHPKKSKLRLSFPGKSVIDDVKIQALAE